MNFTITGIFLFDILRTGRYHTSVLTHIVRLDEKNIKLIWRGNMKKTLILLAMAIVSVFFFTACGPVVASSGDAAFTSAGNAAFASDGNAPYTSAGNAG